MKKIKIDNDPLFAGSATGHGAYKPGTEVEIKATPETGFEFSGWVFGQEVIMDNPVTVTVPNGDIDITAKFVKSG